MDLSVSAEGRVVPPNPDDDKSHLKETVKHGHCIKSSVKVNYKIYESLIEWVSGEWSGREAAGKLLSDERQWLTHSSSWDLVCVMDVSERGWFIPGCHQQTLVATKPGSARSLNHSIHGLFIGWSCTITKKVSVPWTPPKSKEMRIYQTYLPDYLHNGISSYACGGVLTSAHAQQGLSCPSKNTVMSKYMRNTTDCFDLIFKLQSMWGGVMMFVFL